MKLIPALLLAVSLCMSQGCFGYRAASKEVENLKHQIMLEKSSNTFLVNHPAIVTKQVEKIIQDTTAEMGWLKFLGILLIGLGIGITVLGAVWGI